MSLPYRWHPLGANPYKSTKDIEPGVLVAHEHVAYWVVEKNHRPDDPDWPWRIHLHPVEIPGDDPESREHDRFLKATDRTRWDIYPDVHFPICWTCREPLPCRDQMAELVARRAARELDRYSYEAVCPACQEPVSPRQKSKTFSENLMVPGGPPVMFHLRDKCWREAMEYEKRWVAAEPARRKLTMSCPGSVTQHYDGRRDCTEPGCPPGSKVWHPSSSTHYPGRVDCECVAGVEPPEVQRRAAAAMPPADPEGDQIDQNLLRILEEE